MSFHLVRHGQTFGNIGQKTRENDDELTAEGEAQVIELSRNPAFLEIVAKTDVFLCIPLRLMNKN
jgi:broad specificity phosphatase PhoE